MEYMYQTEEMDDLINTLNSTEFFSAEFIGTITMPFFVDPKETEIEIEKVWNTLRKQLFLSSYFERYIMIALRSLVDYRRQNGLIFTGERRPYKNGTKKES